MKNQLRLLQKVWILWYIYRLLYQLWDHIIGMRHHPIQFWKKILKSKKNSHFYPEILLSKREQHRSNIVLFWVMHMDNQFIALPNGITARMIFHCIDIGFVAFKILNVISSTHIPNKGHFVTSLIKKFLVMKKGGKIQILCIYIHIYILKKKLTPDTNVFGLGPGAKSKDITSALCPWKDCKTCPDSTSWKKTYHHPFLKC